MEYVAATIERLVQESKNGGPSRLYMVSTYGIGKERILAEVTPPHTPSLCHCHGLVCELLPELSDQIAKSNCLHHMLKVLLTWHLIHHCNTYCCCKEELQPSLKFGLLHACAWSVACLILCFSCVA